MKILSKPRQWIKPFFTLNKSEQRGIIALSMLIMLAIILNQFIPQLVVKNEFEDPEFVREVTYFLEQQRMIKDSIRIVELQNRGELDDEMAAKKLSPFPFDPNLATEKDFLKLGLTAKQSRTIMNYLSKGGKFRKKEDLAKIYGISESEYRILEPFIVFSTEKDKANVLPPKSLLQLSKSSFKTVELNSIDSASLVENLCIKPWLAKRIIKYRALLGGFYHQSQMFEVYGFDSIEVSERLDFMTVDTIHLKRLNINTDSFKQLTRHPYISYELTKYIVNMREKTGGFRSAEALLDSDLITGAQWVKMKPYLSVK